MLSDRTDKRPWLLVTWYIKYKIQMIPVLATQLLTILRSIIEWYFEY